MADYFHNFAPADAVQWTGTDDGFDIVAEHLADQGFDLAQSGDMLAIWTADMLTELHRLRPGQWLVRQGDRVWVQDEEPARVERWYYGNRVGSFCTNGLCSAQHDTQRRHPGQEWFGTGHYDSRQPVVRTPDGSLWSGPWTPVEGGAE